MKLAVICSVYNEEALLPQFLDYYSPQVDTVFLLDNESTDATRLIAMRYPNVEVSSYGSGGKFSDLALSEAYDRKRAECAGRFDYVILADCDEFVVPKFGASLAEAVQAATPQLGSGLYAEFFWTQGFNMWASPEEAAFDPSRSILTQRRTGIPSPIYSKPCVIRPESPLKYEHGRHNFRWHDGLKPTSFDFARFFLLHYIGFDEEVYVRRALDRTSRFSEENVQMRTSVQYLDQTEESYRENFRANATSPEAMPVPFDGAGFAARLSRRKLEIGSGVTPTPGYDTVDKNPESKATYTFDLLSASWPIEEASYDEVLLIHVLEHLPMSKVGIVLRRVLRVMRPGGILRVHVPNGPLVAKAYLEQPSHRFKVQMTIYGAEAETDPQFAHKMLYDFTMLRTTLLSAGFAGVEELTDKYEDHHDPHWTWMGGRLSLKVRARKPQ